MRQFTRAQLLVFEWKNRWNGWIARIGLGLCYIGLARVSLMLRHLETDPFECD